MGEAVDGDDLYLHSRIVRYRAALWFFHVAPSSFLIMYSYILFCEIVVVNFMFIQNTKASCEGHCEIVAVYELKSSGIKGVWVKTGKLLRP